MSLIDLTVAQLDFVLRSRDLELPVSLAAQPSGARVADVASAEVEEDLDLLWRSMGSPVLDFTDLPDPARHLAVVRAKEVAEASSGFAGLWYHPDSNTLNILLTDARLLPALSSDVINIELHEAEHSYDSLRSTLHELSVDLERAGLRADLRIDEQRNRVEIRPYVGARPAIASLIENRPAAGAIALAPEDISGSFTGVTIPGGLGLSGGCTSGFAGDGPAET